jgi:hypothetical protein
MVQSRIRQQQLEEVVDVAECPSGRSYSRGPIAAWMRSGLAKALSRLLVGDASPDGGLHVAVTAAWALLTVAMVLPTRLSIVFAVSSLSVFLWSGRRTGVVPAARCAYPAWNATPRRAR